MQELPVFFKLFVSLVSKGLPVLVTVGPDKGPGQFLLFGEEKQVSQIGPK